jgi:hypothetical protein
VAIGIVFANVVAIFTYRFMGRKGLKPILEVMVQARLIVIDKYRRSNVHGVHESEPFFYAALSEALLHL